MNDQLNGQGMVFAAANQTGVEPASKTDSSGSPVASTVVEVSPSLIAVFGGSSRWSGFTKLSRTSILSSDSTY